MKYWVFDLDGTLVDSLTIYFQNLEKIFRQFGLEFSPILHDELLKISPKTLPQYFEMKFGNENAPRAVEMFHRLDSLATQTVQPFPGIKELLNTLHAQDKKLAVWTARDLETTTKILNNTGLNSYFAICVSATCVEHGKPHPEGLKKISDHFNCEREAMVMVGDFDSDMMGAKDFGIKAIRVFWHPAVQVKKCTLADWQFHQVSEFITWIKSNLK